MLRACGQHAGDGVAVLLRLIDAIGEVLHPWMREIIGAVVAVFGGIPAHLQPVKQVGFGHHIVMLAGTARIAGVIRHQHAVDIRQRVGLRAARLASVEAPELIAHRTILFIPETAFLNIFRLVVIEIGAIHGAARINNVGEIPAQNDVIDAIAIFGVALFNDFQPQQHAADIQRREADLARFVQVVHLLRGDGVIGFVRYLAAKQIELMERAKHLQHPAVKLRLIDNAQFAGGHQCADIRAGIPHGGGGILVYGVHQPRCRLVVDHEILPGVFRHFHFALGQLAVTRRIVVSGQFAPGMRRHASRQHNQEGYEAKKEGQRFKAHGVTPAEAVAVEGVCWHPRQSSCPPLI